jgi:hypothetical protein
MALSPPFVVFPFAVVFPLAFFVVVAGCGFFVFFVVFVVFVLPTRLDARLGLGAVGIVIMSSGKSRASPQIIRPINQTCSSSRW